MSLAWKEKNSLNEKETNIDAQKQFCLKYVWVQLIQSRGNWIA